MMAVIRTKLRQSFIDVKGEFNFSQALITSDKVPGLQKKAMLIKETRSQLNDCLSPLIELRGGFENFKL